MCDTVSWALLSLNLCEYTHIVVKKRVKHGYVDLGGGSLSSVLRRFGGLKVDSSNITSDGILQIFVKGE